MQVLCVGGWRGGGEKGGSGPLKQPEILFVSLASPAVTALQPGEAGGRGWKPLTPLFAATTRETFLCKNAQSKQRSFLLMRARCVPANPVSRWGKAGEVVAPCLPWEPCLLQQHLHQTGCSAVHPAGCPSLVVENNSILGAGGVWFAFAGWGFGPAPTGAAVVSRLGAGCLQHPAEDGAPTSTHFSQSESPASRARGVCLEHDSKQRAGDADSTKSSESTKHTDNATLTLIAVASGSLYSVEGTA